MLRAPLQRLYVRLGARYPRVAAALEFTVIGDTVSTAARVETITRETDDTVLVTDATCALLQREHGGFRERGSGTLRAAASP